MAHKPLKTLCIFDLDNTLINSFDSWCILTDRAITQYAALCNVEKTQIEQRLVQAHMSVRFGDIADMIVWFDQKFMPAKTERFQRAWHDLQTKKIINDWRATELQLSVFYDGVLETLKTLKKSGVKLVIQTNAEREKAKYRLWCLAYNAYQQDPAFTSTEHVLNLFDAIYTREDHTLFDTKDTAVDSPKIESAFDQLFYQKTKTLPREKSKPAIDGSIAIMEQFNTDKDAILFIGDHTDDALAAKRTDIDFAHAKYGTFLSDFTLEMDKRIGEEDYPIGHEVIEKAFSDLGIQPKIILAQGLKEILSSKEAFHFPAPPKKNNNFIRLFRPQHRQP